MAAQIPPLLQLHPHRKTYRTCVIGVVACAGSQQIMRRVSGRAQGFFTRTGLEGWGTWKSLTAFARFDGEWHAGKRCQGVWKPDHFRSFKGSFVSDRLHGKVLCMQMYGPSAHVFTCVYDMGRVVSHNAEGVWED